jgi:hypothetical protein
MSHPVTTIAVICDPLCGGAPPSGAVVSFRNEAVTASVVLTASGIWESCAAKPLADGPMILPRGAERHSLQDVKSFPAGIFGRRPEIADRKVDQRRAMVPPD